MGRLSQKFRAQLSFGLVDLPFSFWMAGWLKGSSGGEVDSFSSCFCCCCCLPVVPLVHYLPLLRFKEMGPRKQHSHIELASSSVGLAAARFPLRQVSKEASLLEYNMSIMVVVEHKGSVKGNVFLTSPDRLLFDVSNNVFFKV